MKLSERGEDKGNFLTGIRRLAHLAFEFLPVDGVGGSLGFLLLLALQPLFEA